MKSTAHSDQRQPLLVSFLLSLQPFSFLFSIPPLSSFLIPSPHFSFFLLQSPHFSSLFPIFLLLSSFLFFHLISSSSFSSVPFFLLYAIHLFCLYFILLSSFLIPSSHISSLLPLFILHSPYIFSVFPLFLLHATYFFSPYLILSLPPSFSSSSHFLSSLHLFSSLISLHPSTVSALLFLFLISPVYLISHSVSIFYFSLTIISPSCSLYLHSPLISPSYFFPLSPLLIFIISFLFFFLIISHTFFYSSHSFLTVI